MEGDAVFAERVKAGGLRPVAAIKADSIESELISHHQEHVRLLGGHAGACLRGDDRQMELHSRAADASEARPPGLSPQQWPVRQGWTFPWPAAPWVWPPAGGAARGDLGAALPNRPRSQSVAAAPPHHVSCPRMEDSAGTLLSAVQVRPGQRLRQSWSRVSLTPGELRKTVALTRSDLPPTPQAEKPEWMRIREVERPTARSLRPWDFVTTRNVISEPCKEGSQVSFEAPSWFHSRYFGKDRVPVGPYRSVAIGRRTMLVPDFEDDPMDDARARDHSTSLPALPGVGRAILGGIPGARPSPRAGKPYAGRRALTMASTYGTGLRPQDVEAAAAADYEAVPDEPVRWAARTRAMPPRAHRIPRVDGRPPTASAAPSGRGSARGAQDPAVLGSARLSGDRSARSSAGHSARSSAGHSSRSGSARSGQGSGSARSSGRREAAPSARSLRSRGDSQSIAFRSTRRR